MITVSLRGVDGSDSHEVHWPADGSVGERVDPPVSSGWSPYRSRSTRCATYTTVATVGCPHVVDGQAAALLVRITAVSGAWSCEWERLSEEWVDGWVGMFRWWMDTCVYVSECSCVCLIEWKCVGVWLCEGMSDYMSKWVSGCVLVVSRIWWFCVVQTSSSRRQRT